MCLHVCVRKRDFTVFSNDIIGSGYDWTICTWCIITPVDKEMAGLPPIWIGQKTEMESESEGNVKCVRGGGRNRELQRDWYTCQKPNQHEREAPSLPLYHLLLTELDTHSGRREKQSYYREIKNESLVQCKIEREGMCGREIKREV